MSDLKTQGCASSNGRLEESVELVQVIASQLGDIGTQT